MQNAIKKAEVLIEALPYIKSYHEKVIVIKFGGSALLNEAIKRGVLEDIVFMSFVGIRPVIVHGGGPSITQELKKIGRKAEFVDGVRVTQKEDMEIIDRVLTEINREIVKMICQLGGKAVSLNTKNKDIIRTQIHIESSKLGSVGEINSINSVPIKEALDSKEISVISPVGIGPDKEMNNVNADNASSAISVELKAAKLVLLTDVQGILRHPGDENSLIATLNTKEIKALIERKVIHQGMIPKVNACINALKGGVNKTHIIDGRTPHSLLLEVFTDKGIGTEIVR